MSEGQSTVWWRRANEPVGPEEEALVAAVLEAHAQCVVRVQADGAPVLPCSSAGMINAWHGSRDYAKAMAGGLLTLGAVHGPIEAAYELMAAGGHQLWRVVQYLDQGRKVPGWGNAFVKGGPDAGWGAVELLLPEPVRAMLGRVTEVLHSRGKKVWPNPAGYTAAAAWTLGMPKEVATWFFVQGRLAGWTRLILNAIGRAA